METRFFQERSLKLPWQGRLKPVSPDQARRGLEQGKEVWAQPDDAELPLPVRTAEQMQTALDGPAGDLSELSRKGFAFQGRVAGQAASVGAYGAYLALLPRGGVEDLQLLEPATRLPIPARSETLSDINAFYSRENEFAYWNAAGERIASYRGEHEPGSQLGGNVPWFKLDGKERQTRLDAMAELTARVSEETAARTLEDYLAGGSLVDCATRPEEQLALAELALGKRPALQEQAASLPPAARVALVRAGKPLEIPAWVDGLPAADRELVLAELDAASPEELGRRLAAVSKQLRSVGTQESWKRAATFGAACLRGLYGLEAPDVVNPGSTVALCETYFEHPDQPALASQAVRDKGYEKSWQDAVKVGRMLVEHRSDRPACALALQVEGLECPGSYTRLYEAVLENPDPPDLGALAADISVKLRSSGYTQAWSEASKAGRAFVKAMSLPARELGSVRNPGSAVIVYEASLRSQARTMDEIAALGLELSQQVRAKKSYVKPWWDAAEVGRAFCQHLARQSPAARAAVNTETVFNPGSIVAVYEGVLADPRAEVGPLGRQLSQVVRGKNYPEQSWNDAVKVGRAFVAGLPHADPALQVADLTHPGSYVMTYEACLETAGQEPWRVGTAAVNAVMSRNYDKVALDALKVAESYRHELPPDSLGRLLDQVSQGTSNLQRLGFLREALEQPAPATPQAAAEGVLSALANNPGQNDELARKALGLLESQVEDPAMRAYLRKGIDSQQPAEPVRILDMLAHQSFFQPPSATVVEQDSYVQILGSRVKVRKPAPTVSDEDGSTARDEGAGQAGSTITISIR